MRASLAASGHVIEFNNSVSPLFSDANTWRTESQLARKRLNSDIAPYGPCLHACIDAKNALKHFVLDGAPDADEAIVQLDPAVFPAAEELRGIGMAH